MGPQQVHGCAARRQDTRHCGSRPHRSGGGGAGAGIRHAGARFRSIPVARSRERAWDRAHRQRPRHASRGRLSDRPHAAHRRDPPPRRHEGARDPQARDQADQLRPRRHLRRGRSRRGTEAGGDRRSGARRVREGALHRQPAVRHAGSARDAAPRRQHRGGAVAGGCRGRGSARRFPLHWCDPPRRQLVGDRPCRPRGRPRLPRSFLAARAPAVAARLGRAAVVLDRLPRRDRLPQHPTRDRRLRGRPPRGVDRGRQHRQRRDAAS